MVDFFNIVRGHIDTDAGLTDLIPIQGMASSPHLDFSGEIRAATQFPTFHAARIQDVATARHAIAAGKVDMVGMTRAHMTDPHIVRKIVEGREDRIRPCVGANYCLDRIYQGGAAYCIHNPLDGARTVHAPRDRARAAIKRKVVVVGAGPAGLEAARVAAERGHEVHRVRGRRRARRPDTADRAKSAPPGNARHHRLAHARVRGARRGVPVRVPGGGAGGACRSAGRRRDRNRRPAAHRTCWSPATSSSSRPGTSSRATPSRPAGCCCSTMPAITRRCRPPS